MAITLLPSSLHPSNFLNKWTELLTVDSKRHAMLMLTGFYETCFENLSFQSRICGLHNDEAAGHVSYFIPLYIIIRPFWRYWQIESLQIGGGGWIFYESLVWTVQNFCTNCLILRRQAWRFESSVNWVIGFGDSSSLEGTPSNPNYSLLSFCLSHMPTFCPLPNTPHLSSTDTPAFLYLQTIILKKK